MEEKFGWNQRGNIREVLFTSLFLNEVLNYQILIFKVFINHFSHNSHTYEFENYHNPTSND